MGDSASPLMLRRRLRTELRTARLDSNLTQDQVAKAMDWSLSKMNRIEKAKTGISTNDLKALLPLYRITDKKRTQELLDLARAARRHGWWQEYSDVAPGRLLELIDYESAASTVHQFETTFVPGILQTEEYASAILQEFHSGNMPDENVRMLVELRTRRRDLLVGAEAPKFSFVLDESVVHRVVGSPAATSKQFRHLVSTAELPSVTIQIVPFTAGLHPGLGGAFEVVGFDDTDDENIVYFEDQRGDFIGEDPGEASRYLKAFHLIEEKSLAPADSLALLRKAAAEMG
jgi:transcriptional regulator with XRE-family HTH domain